jgi:DNA-binding MarR family transcriptional regulator
VLQRADTWLDIDATLPQLRALFLVGQHQPVTVSDLAALLGQRLAAVSALVTRLVRTGWLRRAEDPSDRRRVLLSLSDEGVTLLEGINDRSASRFSEMLRRMSPQGREHLAIALDELVGLVAEPSRDRAHDQR